MVLKIKSNDNKIKLPPQQLPMSKKTKNGESTFRLGRY